MREPNLTPYNGMPDHTMLRSEDIIKVFDYTGVACAVSSLIKDNLIPEPSIRANDISSIRVKRFGDLGFESQGRENYRYWTLGDLRKIKNKLAEGG